DQTLTGELTTSRPRVAYQLLVEPGSAVSIALNSDAFDSYLTIMDAAGNVIASNDDGGGSLNSLIGAFSPPAGVTYYVVVSSLNGTDPGAYTLELKSVVVSTGGPINTGETLNGVSGGSSTLYTFTASAGDSITITLRSPDFDTFVRLLDADGQELASDDDSGGDLDSQIAFFTVPSDGTYTISVEAFGDNVAAGTYTLSLSTAVTRLIEYTQVIDANLTPDATDGYRFRGQAGDVVSISMTSADFDSYLTLFDDATNTTLTTNDDGGGNRNALIGPFVLPATGDYLIAARSYGAGEGGAYTLSLNKVILTPAAYGDAIQGSFDGSAPAVYYSFTGTSGDVVSLNVTSNLDTTLTVNDPNNYQAAFDDDGGAGYNPEINQLILSATGTYTVIVGSYGGSVVGDFTLTINGAQPRSLDESAQQVELSDKRQQESLVFTGTAGQTVTVVAQIISSSDSATPTLDIQQNGSSLAYQTLEAGSTVMRTDVTVPADGLVTVIVSDYSYTPVVIEVSLEKGG
ncbi:MAG: PPC domain-containing protein, partial [Anaerolineae bacterium]|nr:PPC domain-containing protein [Anaerolineae bacterium]